MWPSLPEHLAQKWDRRPYPPGAAARAAEPTPGHGDVMLVGLAADEHLHAVEHELRRRGAGVVRVDSDGRPSPTGFDHRPPTDTWSYRGVLCRSVNVGAGVAHHAERCARFAPEQADPVPRTRDFARGQSRMALLGMLDAVDTPTWVNDPWTMPRADVKARQMRVAAREGLRVPRTLVSDDPTAIAGFAEEVGSLVFKSLTDAFVWEEADEAGFLYTCEVTPGDLADLGRRIPVPGIFQERLAARAEYRVTVVDKQSFCARTAVTADGVDWRRGLPVGVAFERVELDPVVTDAVTRTVAALGLRFAAVDLLEAMDEIWFLEVNPTGAYGWLERSLGLPITAALCDLLLGDDH